MKLNANASKAFVLTDDPSSSCQLKPEMLTSSRRQRKEVAVTSDFGWLTFVDSNFVPVLQIEFEIFHRVNENLNLMGALQEKVRGLGSWDYHWTSVDIFQSEPLHRPGHQQSRADWKAKIKQRLMMTLFIYLHILNLLIFDWVRLDLSRRIWLVGIVTQKLINVSFNTKNKGCN